MTRRNRFVLICGAFLVAVSLALPTLIRTAEIGVYKIAPSQERAVRYGDRHFHASNTYLYDIESAEYFYSIASEYDTPHPYLAHQLARLAFLEGEFNLALFHINRQIESHGDALPNSHYMRGLIRGYMGDYDVAADDYAHYISLLATPNWAAYTDYAWVLLKAGRHEEAAQATETGLSIFPDNAWLLNTSAIALYELGQYAKALERSQKAVAAADKVTADMWLSAYPGNDPRIAKDGIATLQQSARDNMHKIEEKVASSTVQ